MEHQKVVLKCNHTKPNEMLSTARTQRSKIPSDAGESAEKFFLFGSKEAEFNLLSKIPKAKRQYFQKRFEKAKLLEIISLLEQYAEAEQEMEKLT